MESRFYEPQGEGGNLRTVAGNGECPRIQGVRIPASPEMIPAEHTPLGVCSTRTVSRELTSASGVDYKFLPALFLDA
jgi:hypothetical protein